MVLIGIITTAAGAIYLFRRIQDGDLGEPDEVIRIIRQTTGIVLAVTNFVRAALEAWLLIRPAAPAASGGSLSRALIGNRAGDVD